jgi:hypothetical protein
VLNPGTRYPTLAVLTAVLAVMGYYMTLLKPTEKTEQFLSDDHPLQKAITILNEGFPVASDDRGANHYFIWGIEDVDRTGVNQMFEPENIGKAVYQDGWVFSPECQEKVLEVCSNFRTDAMGQLEGHVKRAESGLFSVSCWPSEMKHWLEGSESDQANYYGGDECERGSTAGYTWPIPSEDVDAAMVWLAHAPTCDPDAETPGMNIHNHYAQQARGVDSMSNAMGWDGEKLSFLAISVESSILDPWSEIAEDTARAEYEFFLALRDVIDNEWGVEEACGPVKMTDIDQK